MPNRDDRIFTETGLAAHDPEGTEPHDQRFHWQFRSAQDLTDQVERPLRIIGDNQEVDIAALLLRAPRERPEEIHGLDAEITNEWRRELRQLAKKGFTCARIERADCRHVAASPSS